MKKSTKKVWLIVGIVFLIIAIAVGIYFLVKGGKKDSLQTAIDEAYKASLDGTVPANTPSAPSAPVVLNYTKPLKRGGTSQKEETKKLQMYLNWALANPQQTPAGMLAAISPIGIAGFKATANNVIKAASSSAVAYDSTGANKFQLTVDGAFGPVTEAVLKAFTSQTQITLTDADTKLGIPSNIA